MSASGGIWHARVSRCDQALSQGGQRHLQLGGACPHHPDASDTYHAVMSRARFTVLECVLVDLEAVNVHELAACVHDCPAAPHACCTRATTFCGVKLCVLAWARHRFAQRPVNSCYRVGRQVSTEDCERRALKALSLHTQLVRPLVLRQAISQVYMSILLDWWSLDA